MQTGTEVVEPSRKISGAHHNQGPREVASESGLAGRTRIASVAGHSSEANSVRYEGLTGQSPPTSTPARVFVFLAIGLSNADLNFHDPELGAYPEVGQSRWLTADWLTFVNGSGS